MSRDIVINRLWNSSTITTGTTSYSDIIDIGTFGKSGTFSLQYYISTAGVSVSLGYLLSNDYTNFVQSTEGNLIASGLTNISGQAANGRDVITFTPTMARFMKLAAWETAGATNATLTAHFAVQ